MVIEYLTAILVLITAIYAYLTYRIVKASEASVEAISTQSEVMLRPYITIASFIRPHTSLLYLRISNSGRTTAHNVQLAIDKDCFQFGDMGRPDRKLRTISAFSSPIDSFPPGTELNFCLGKGPVLLDHDAKEEAVPTQFSITATYEFAGKQVSEVSRIDLRPYIGTEADRDPIAEELERIRKVMESCSMSK